ncbi:MAG: hypothetical protein E7503_06680 [Ruminococcus sp.]|nr:hypothetical protein [Ruminococcus sp.]
MDEGSKTTPQAPPTEPQPAPAPAPAPAPQTPPQETPAPAPAEPKEYAPSADELEAFRKWKESQQSEAEKQAAAISKAEKARTAAEAKAAAAELKLTAMRKGVPADALDDVIALAKTKITDKVTAEAAIDEIIRKYPAFSAAGAASGTTGAATPNNPPPTGTDEAKARRIMGLPPLK